MDIDDETYEDSTAMHFEEITYDESVDIYYDKYIELISVIRQLEELTLYCANLRDLSSSKVNPNAIPNSIGKTNIEEDFMSWISNNFDERYQK